MEIAAEDSGATLSVDLTVVAASSAWGQLTQKFPPLEESNSSIILLNDNTTLLNRGVLPQRKVFSRKSHCVISRVFEESGWKYNLVDTSYVFPPQIGAPGDLQGILSRSCSSFVAILSWRLPYS